MTFRRFLAWIIEKAFELQLFVALLVTVKFVLPTAPKSFTSLDAFAQGMSDQWSGSLDEMTFMSHAFMNGNYALYILKTYEAAAYIIGIHFYFWSFYLFTSIFACLAGPRGYLRNAIIAYVVSAVFLAFRERELFDLQNACLAGAMLVGGFIVVLLSALAGKWLDFRLTGAKTPSQIKSRAKAEKLQSVRGRVRYDLG